MELAMGGNKARKLEPILGHALSGGYNYVIPSGAYHSNHVRLAIAAARKAGLDTYAVLYKHMEGAEPELQGNIILDKILGVWSSTPTRQGRLRRLSGESLRS